MQVSSNTNYLFPK